jgi:photosystem II stability/assembly factor-like uncharacterized protein
VFVKKKFFLLLIISLTFLQSAAAQVGWQANRVKSAGDLITVYFTSAEKGWIAGDEGYLAYTIDGGRTWLQYSLPTTENINEIYFRNDENGYIAAGKKIFVTKDGGATWLDTRIYNPNEFKAGTPDFLSVRFTDKKRGFVIGSVLNKSGNVIDSLVLQTNDGGESWFRVTVPSKGELYHLDFSGKSHGWIVGDKGVILHTRDGGVSWSLQNSGTDRALFNVDFRDDNEGYVVGGRGTILRTENGGRNWELVKTAFPSTFLRVDFADDKNGWIVGYNGTILRSSDKGKTWIKQESETTENLYGLFTQKKFGWAVGAKGAILRYQK